MNGLQLPNWIIPLAGFAAAVWAIAMWWMVATMPNSGASEAELDLIVARAEIDRLQLDVDELGQQIAALHQERSELSLRLDSLEQAPVAGVAVQTTQPIAPVAGPPPADATDERDPADDEPDAADEPSEDDRRATATPTPAPTAERTAIVEPTATPAAVQYFTDGRDRYNCKDFDSWEEAQAAYEANLPGDPNKIDIDRNGIACEALR